MPDRAPRHRPNILPTTKTVKVHRPAAIDGRRKPRGSSDSFYGSRTWRTLRRFFLRRFPFCSDPFGTHGAEGLPVAADHVDHVVPRREAPARSLDFTNLQGLCVSCHSRKTRAEEAARRRGRASR